VNEQPRTPDEEIIQAQAPAVASTQDDSQRLDRIRAEFERGFELLRDLDCAVSIFGSARIPEGDPQYELARAVARELSQSGMDIITGGGPGIMEAANRGAHEAGGKSIGFNIRLPFEQGANRYITDGLHFEFHYFFMRKFWFAYLAKALVIFPGGFGTLDEMFEILTLSQTQKLSKQLGVFIYGREYWEEIIDLEPMAEWGAVRPQDLDLLKWVNTPEEAFEQLRAHLMAYHLVPETAQEDKAPGIAKTRG
jgi:uncharacterized protein (TIGR00730 family)